MLTDLSKDSYNSLLNDIAVEGLSTDELRAKYHLSFSRLKNIISKERIEIDKLKRVYIEQRRNLLVPQLYKQILDDLDHLKTSKKINKAKYGEILRGLKDLHAIARLEDNKSTENVGVDLTGKSREELIRFVYESEEIGLNESKSE